MLILILFFFFFQAEDGIRDRDVTGVQTCALPILGYGTTNYDWREPGFSDVVLQGDGKIVAVGDYGLVRLNPDGTTDDSFVTDPPYTDPRSFAAVALQADGKIVVAGHEYNYATDDSDFFVARY